MLRATETACAGQTDQSRTKEHPGNGFGYGSGGGGIQADVVEITLNAAGAQYDGDRFAYIGCQAGVGDCISRPVARRGGNPGLRDAYSFLSLEVAYKISLKKKAIYGQTAMK